MSRPFSTLAALLMVAATSHVVAQQQGTTASAVTAPPNMARLLSSKVGALTTIQGNALDSTNGQLANVLVRLRDARFGRIVDTQYTDQSGMFAFKAVEPGSYIVEIIGNDESILAASQLLNVHARRGGLGGRQAAVPRPAVRGFDGHRDDAVRRGPAALQAAATGITALVPTAPISPNQ